MNILIKIILTGLTVAVSSVLYIKMSNKGRSLNGFDVFMALMFIISCFVIFVSTLVLIWR